ncbi:hypothetical protein T459_29320 [Capsicum annuum]|uniref:very-long-chain (3R)-3-hydroxyacyl-CoA dehydratase n=1 Tax=Capsicum annuum TaxID=4072 RepID=A0A2G2Y571_CAPAN|nr:hypothetical protein T459_29320 [Capsicum annuum]
MHKRLQETTDILWFRTPSSRPRWSKESENPACVTQQYDASVTYSSSDGVNGTERKRQPHITFQVFYFGVKTLNEFGHEHVYDAVEKPLLFAQTAAFLEISSIGYSSTDNFKIIRNLGNFVEFSRDYSVFIFWHKGGIWFCTFLALVAKESGKYAVRMPNKWNFSFDYYYASLVGLAIYVPGKNLNTILLLKSSPRSAPSFCVLWLLYCCPYLYSYMLGQRKKAVSKTKAA